MVTESSEELPPPQLSTPPSRSRAASARRRCGNAHKHNQREYVVEVISEAQARELTAQSLLKLGCKAASEAEGSPVIGSPALLLCPAGSEGDEGSCNVSTATFDCIGQYKEDDAGSDVSVSSDEDAIRNRLWRSLHSRSADLASAPPVQQACEAIDAAPAPAVAVLPEEFAAAYAAAMATAMPALEAAPVRPPPASARAATAGAPQKTSAPQVSYGGAVGRTASAGSAVAAAGLAGAAISAAAASAGRGRPSSERHLDGPRLLAEQAVPQSARATGAGSSRRLSPPPGATAAAHGGQVAWRAAAQPAPSAQQRPQTARCPAAAAVPVVGGSERVRGASSHSPVRHQNLPTQQALGGQARGGSGPTHKHTSPPGWRQAPMMQKHYAPVLSRSSLSQVATRSTSDQLRLTSR